MFLIFFSNSRIFLFLDLTHPEEFQSVLEPILNVLRTRLNQILTQINIQNPTAFTELQNHFISNKEHKVNCLTKIQKNINLGFKSNKTIRNSIGYCWCTL